MFHAALARAGVALTVSTEGDQFGFTIKLVYGVDGQAGQGIAIGAPRALVNGQPMGKVYVFKVQRNGTGVTVTQVGNTINNPNSPPSPGLARFGAAISALGDVARTAGTAAMQFEIAIGAPGKNGAAGYAGVFEYQPGTATWSEIPTGQSYAGAFAQWGFSIGALGNFSSTYNLKNHGFVVGGPGSLTNNAGSARVILGFADPAPSPIPSPSDHFLTTDVVESELLNADSDQFGSRAFILPRDNTDLDPFLYDARISAPYSLGNSFHRTLQSSPAPWITNVRAGYTYVLNGSGGRPAGGCANSGYPAPTIAALPPKSEPYQPAGPFHGYGNVVVKGASYPSPTSGPNLSEVECWTGSLKTTPQFLGTPGCYKLVEDTFTVSGQLERSWNDVQLAPTQMQLDMGSRLNLDPNASGCGPLGNQSCRGQVYFIQCSVSKDLNGNAIPLNLRPVTNPMLVSVKPN